MSARKQSISLVAFQATPSGGSSLNYLCNLTDIRVRLNNELVDGKCITESYEYMQLVKKGAVFTASMQQSATPNTKPMQTNLSVTAYTIGGVSYLGDLTSFSMSLTNNVAEGAGLADTWAYPNVVSRTLGFEGVHLIGSSVVQQPLIEILADSNEAAQAVSVVFTGGLADFTLPAIFESIEHVAAREGLQEYTVQMKPRGAPTAPTDTASLLGCAFGSASVSLWLDTGAGQYALTGTRINALITSFSLEVKDRAIINHTFEFTTQGDLAFASS